MMVAAHSFDLKAAAKLGFATAHIARPNEAGSGLGEPKPTAPVDIAAKDLGDLATKLGT
jgi:2-haloacid dehalogenase